MVARADRLTGVRIFTIGYEKATQAELVAALGAAGVERVIDVRAVPLSRRPGFSKNVLAAGLKEAGIDYVHLKALGTPPEGREAARKGRHDVLERVYAAQLDTPEVRRDVDQGAIPEALAGGRRDLVGASVLRTTVRWRDSADPRVRVAARGTLSPLPVSISTAVPSPACSRSRYAMAIGQPSVGLGAALVTMLAARPLRAVGSHPLACVIC
mgnify:CR=1 FL=1